MRPPNISDVSCAKPATSKSFDSLRFNESESSKVADEFADPAAGANAGSAEIAGFSPSKRTKLHFSDDFARLALGPGNFLSRSQDSLSGVRRPLLAGLDGIGGVQAAFSTSQRPDSALSGFVKSAGSGKNKSGLCSVGVRAMSSAQLGNRRVNSPLIEKSVNELNSPTAVVQKPSKKIASSSSQAADARIARTKMTVTELQKQKHDLESYVSELVKKAEVKQAELVGMKIEIRRLKEEKGEEYEKLAQQNELLKQRVQRCTCQNACSINNNDSIVNKNDTMGAISIDCNDIPGKMLIDASTSPVGDFMKAVSSDETTGDSDEALPSGATTNRAVAGEWDRQSTSSEISLACLQDRIVQMEETHYSTNEELQATLQELTDLQDTVNELTKENQQLFEDKTLLYESLCKQSEKVDNYRLQIENLKHLLLSSTEIRFNRRFASSPMPKRLGEGDSKDFSAQFGDREQQLLGILKNAHEEHEDLLKKFENVRNAFKCQEEERKIDSHVIENLKERLEMLEKHLEKAKNERKCLESNFCECKQQMEKDKREILRLSNAFEKEKNRADELLRHANVKDKDDTQRALQLLRIEKDRAQDQALALEESLSLKFEEISRLSDLVQRLENEIDNVRNENVKNLSINEEKLRDFGRENDLLNGQLLELKTALLELDQNCQRHLEDKNEYRAEILNLQKTVDELTMAKEHLQKEIDEINNIRDREAEEWRQFQADLQVAVVVANDFKVEAQEDIERLSTENSQLREKLTQIGLELEKLRNSRLTPPKNRPTTASPSALVSVSPDVRARMSGYLNSIESSKNKQQLLDPKSSSATAKCVLSVRALVESLESATTHRPSINFGTSHTQLRSPGASSTLVVSDKSSDSPVLDSNCSPMSKMNTSSGSSSAHHSLAPRPVSLESIDVPVKPQLRTALSERETLAQQAQVLRGSPQKTNGLLITAADESIDYFDNGANRPNKSLLRGQQLPRKMFYSEIENKDPLAKLMKDAPRGSRRNALLRWCQNRTLGYKNVEVTNFSSSWNDGLAFCALLHSYAPDKIPFHTLDVNDKRRNFTLAFKAAEELGIPAALNVEEMLSLERPNWQSVMSYVTTIYKHFEI